MAGQNSDFEGQISDDDGNQGSGTTGKPSESSNKLSFEPHDEEIPSREGTPTPLVESAVTSLPGAAEQESVHAQSRKGGPPTSKRRGASPGNTNALKSARQ